MAASSRRLLLAIVVFTLLTGARSRELDLEAMRRGAYGYLDTWHGVGTLFLLPAIDGAAAYATALVAGGLLGGSFSILVVATQHLLPLGRAAASRGESTRELLSQGKRPPAEFSRPEVADVLMKAYATA